ncbi:MAG TPA: molecular chaperone DnaK [Thermoanaerobaculia bacterium]|nr:molecular chaperone DnaK [Thermoanaerobaculia bacterium]
MGKVLGIDLGTTNSCVAVVEGVSTPRVLSNREGSRTTASIVAFSPEGDRLVGQIAKRQAITNPQNTVFAVKRLIGRKFQDPNVQRALDIHLPYPLVEAPNGDVKIQIQERAYSPEEISAMILQEVKTFAEEVLDEPVSQAIITVPAYFDDSQRQATRDAGRIAGLEVLRIINEPTAAALAYGMDREGKTENIAVYDLGGGTFDISIMELSEGIFEVRATNGDPDLGGEDFDRRIMDWLVQEFQAEAGIDLRGDRMALQRLKEAAERAKCELSVNQSASINLPFISADDSGPRHLSRTLSRAELEGLVGELVERTRGPCMDALEQAGLTPDQIDQVLLVGGQTRTPLVMRTVEEIFGRAPNRNINPDEVVAMGAAIQGGILKGEIKDVVLLDVTPLSLGIETHGGLFTKLIDRNSTIPTKVTQIFTTVVDNQDTVAIHIVQGERELASDNRSLGKIELVGIPAAPKGVPQIEVTFAIDSNSIHTVTARDAASSQEQTIEINPASGLSQDEVDRLVKEASQFADADREKREVRRVRNRLEGMIHTNDRVLEQFGKTLSDEDRRRIQEMMVQARMALVSGDRVEMETAMFDLNTVAQMLSDLMLRQTAD